jgi:peptidoglycan/LPS O-acetylase OafA/YrhL
MTKVDFGNLGVRIFFVISSFLITGILYEQALRKKIDIKRFYTRRIIRTFPAFYFYLIVVIISLCIAGKFDINQFWRAPLYLENYHSRSLWDHTQWLVGHSWSLAVEEQFYLFVAMTFYFLRKATNLKKSIIKIFLVIVVIAPTARICIALLPNFPDFISGSIHRSFETVADSLAFGGLAYFFSNNINRFLVLKKLNIPTTFIILFLFLCLIQYTNSSYLVNIFGYKPRIFYNLIGLTILNLTIGIIIILLINLNSKNTLYKIFNNEIIVYVGNLSYSIYLWQQIWLYSGWELNFIERLMGIICCSVFSFHFIEKWFLGWRDNKFPNQI